MALIDEFISNLDKLEKDIYSSNDVDNLAPMLSDDEVCKNIVKDKNPNLSDSEVERVVENSDNNSQIKKEARKEKREFRRNFKMFISSQKKITREISNSLVMINSAVPGILITASAPPWNVPAAISTAILVLTVLNNVLNSINELLGYLTTFRKAGLFFSSQNLNKVIIVLNSAVIILIRLLSPLKIIENFINTIINTLKNINSTNNKQKQRNRIVKRLDRKKRILKRTKDLDDREELQDDIELLEDQLKNLDLDNGLNIDSQISQIESDLSKIEQDTQSALSSAQNFINENTYTVKFPDGTIRTNVTQSELEDLKLRFKVDIRSSLN